MSQKLQCSSRFTRPVSEGQLLNLIPPCLTSALTTTPINSLFTPEVFQKNCLSAGMAEHLGIRALNFVDAGVIFSML